MYSSMYLHSFAVLHVLLAGYKATLSHACLITPTRLCDPCTCTLPGVCDQRHYDQVFCVRESKLYSTPHSRISDVLG